MTAAGKINIVLYHRCGLAYAADISSVRPDAAKLLLGKTPEQALATIPLLFSLCGNAQAYAALQACRAAMGLAGEPQLDAAREMLVELEALREHVWRILLDWSGFTAQEADKKSLAALLSFDAQFKRFLFSQGLGFKLDSQLALDRKSLAGLIADLETLLDQAVFKGRLDNFRRINSEENLLAWLQENRSLPASLVNDIYQRHWQSVGHSRIDCLPALDNYAISQQMQQHDLKSFSLTPVWQGRCVETTALNRHLPHPLIANLHSRYQNGLLVRVLARLLDVCRIPSALRQLAAELEQRCALGAVSEFGAGIGIGQVQAARGLLIHRVELRLGRVKAYCIVAPTEWNFHPQGVVAQGLKELRAVNDYELRRQAEWLINALDPCVQYNLTLMASDQAPETHA